MTPDAPFERTTKHAPTNHPPCDEDCWAPLHELATHRCIGWVFTVPANEACRWDDVAKQWTRCNESEQ